MSSILPIIEELKNLGAIFYDFDGVMTDNRVLVTDTGSEVVFCNRSDGLTIRLFGRQGRPKQICPFGLLILLLRRWYNKPVPNPRRSRFFSFPASGNEIYIRSASWIRDIRQS